MIIEYINNVEVITHESGVVSRYTEADLLRFLAEASERKQEADLYVERIRNRLNNVTQQTAKKVGVVRRFAALIKGKRYV